MNLMTLIPLLFQIAPEVQSIIATGISFRSVTSVITNKGLMSTFEQMGAALFPKLAPELHAVAAVITSFSPDYTKWLQGAVNALLPAGSVPLVVDGHYGPKSRAAIETLQAQLGVHIDGWAGDITSAAIQAALSKLK